MNPHDQNMPRQAEFMLARLVATLLFGACCFVVGYLVAEARMKLDPPPCKPIKQAMYESKGDVKYWRAYTRSLPK
jgi:hypothetical protein